MKKWAILMMSVLCMVLLTACGSSHSAGKDTSHPYTWKEQRDGSVQLTIRGAVEDGYEWLVEGTENGIVQVEQESSSKEQTRFSIQPLASGSSVLCFICQRNGLLTEQVFQIVMQLETDEKGKLTVSGVNQTEQTGASSGGEDTENPYAWQMEQSDERVYLAISVAQKDPESMWRIMGEDDQIITVSGPDYGEESCQFRVTGKQVGTSKLVLYDPDRGYAIRMTLSVGEDGQITVTEHEGGPYTPTDEDDKELAQCKAAVGGFTLPEGSRVDYSDPLDWDMDGTDETCELKFGLGDNNWYCLISNGMSPKELMSEYGAADQGEVTDVDGCSVSLYHNDQGIYAVWQDKQGRTFLLEGSGERSKEDIIPVIQGLSGAQNG